MSKQAILDIYSPSIDRSFKKAHDLVRMSEEVKIYTHTDCDGISAGAILSSALDRLEIDHEIEFINLDVISDLKVENELTIFSDLGSGQNLDHFPTSNSKVLVLDHHPPLRNIGKTLKGEFLEINPQHYGISGSYHVSGGGLSYLLAKTFNFKDLSWIGVLSAVGDMQNSLSGKLDGLNKNILHDSVQGKYVNHFNDLSIYGRETKPLYVALSYFGDVKLPTTNNKNECLALLKKMDIPNKKGKKFRTLSDLDMEEKMRIFGELNRMLTLEVPAKYSRYVPLLVSGDIFEFIKEERYTPLRNASEFSTAVNACSRNKNPLIAFKVLKGDRGLALDDMDNLTYKHRRYLAEQMGKLEENNQITALSHLQYFDGNEIKTEVIGTIAGMILSYGDWKKPMVAFTEMGEEKEGLKVSLRCSRLLAYDGIHFGNLIQKVAAKVGGSGGGHSVACGAYIPTSSKDRFLKIFNDVIKNQNKIT